MTPITQITLTQIVKLIKEQKPVSAKIVIKSKKTGQDNTYKIVAKKKYKTYNVDIQFETNYNVFLKCAYYLPYQKTIQVMDYTFKQFPNSIGTIKGAVWFLGYLMKEDYEHIFKTAEVFHTGICLKCGRELTDADSIYYGMGPKCRGFKTLRNRED